MREIINYVVTIHYKPDLTSQVVTITEDRQHANFIKSNLDWFIKVNHLRDLEVTLERDIDREIF